MKESSFKIASLVAQMVKNLPEMQETGLIPGLGRSPREENGNPLQCSWASLVAQLVKNLPAMREDLGSIPGLGRSPGEGNDHALQYSCLENPLDRGVW